MASKYKKFKDKLPAFQLEASYQEKVDAFKKALFKNGASADISQLAERFAKVQAMKEQHENAIKELNVALDAINQMLVSAMDAKDLDKVNLKSGATIGTAYEIYPSVENKEEFMEWVKENKLEGMLTLQWQTLRGLCNELSLEGKPTPKGVKCLIKTQARVYAAKEGK